MKNLIIFYKRVKIDFQCNIIPADTDVCIRLSKLAGNIRYASGHILYSERTTRGARFADSSQL